MVYMFDIIIALIVCFTLFFVIRKGFVKTVFDFASVLVAVILAKVFSPRISDFFYGKIYDGVYAKIKDVVSSLVEKNELPELFESEKISQFLTKYNAELAEKIKTDFINDTVDYIANHLVAFLSYVVAFAVIFLGSLIVLKILSFVVGLIFELPVLKTLNKTLAFILGLILSVIYVLIFVGLAQLLIPVLISVYPETFSEGLIDKTIIFKYLYNLDWLDFLVK